MNQDTMNQPAMNPKKIIVGIAAIISTLVSIFLWLKRSKTDPRKIVIGVAAVILSLVSILLWIWFANIPGYDSTEKKYSDIEVSYQSITSSELK